MNQTDFSTLANQLTRAEYVTCMTRADISTNHRLLDYLQAQPNPFFNYVLCLISADGAHHPVYVGYTNDLPGRMRTHSGKVDFDAVQIYHAPDKQTALANEQALMTLLGTKSLCNGSLTAHTAKVSRDQLTAVLDGQVQSPDPIRRYTESESYTRKTYYLTPAIAEALRTWCFEDRLDLSEAVRIALARGIPEAHLNNAYQKIA